MKVYKNFLNVEEFNKIKNVLLDPSFPWFYNSQILRTSKPIGNFQFTHNFYENNLVQSNYFNLLKPLIDKTLFKYCKNKS